MKLFKQILARLIFLPLILAAGIAAAALLVAQVMFKPADLESVVVNQFQELLKRPVRIEWARLSATGEIKIKGLQVTEPGPEAVDFLRADYIYATYRLLPLLRHKIEIDSVVLVSPKIKLIKHADGTWNITGIFSAHRDGRHSLNKINQTEIKDGELSILDTKSGAAYSLEHFNATLKDFKPEGDCPFYASVYLKSNALRRPVEGRLYTEGTVNFAGFNWTKAEVNGLSADLTLLEKAAHITGSIKNFRRPEITLKAETPEFKSSEMAYLFNSPLEFTAPRSFWDLNAVFTSTKAGEARLTCKPLNLNAEGTFDLSVSPPKYSFTVWTPPFNVAHAKDYSVKLPVESPSGKMQVRIKVSSKDGKTYLSRIFASTTKSGFKYRTLKATDLNMTALLAENFASSYLTASGGKLVMGKDSLSGLNLKTQFSSNELQLDYTGLLNGQPVKGRTAIMQPFSSGKTVNYTGYSRNLVYSEMKNLILGARKLHTAPKKGRVFESKLAWLKTLKNSIPSGYAAFKLLYKADHFKHDYLDAKDFYVSASLKNFTGDISKLRGDISIRSGPGTFYQVQKTSETDRIYYLVSIPLLQISRMNRAGALKFGSQVEDVSFNSIGGDYRIDEGKSEVRNFYLEGKDFSAYASGQIDFSNETMKLKIYTISGKYYSMGSLPEAMTDSSGKPALAFTLEGNMNKPEFKMLNPTDSGKIIKAAAEKGAEIDFAKINRFVGGK